LKISDYGRNVYKLIEYARAIEERDKRNQVAEAIVEIMSQLDPDHKNQEDDKRKYWVHLMILANWDLDVDIPYEISREETVEFQPEHLSYERGESRYRHYGNIMEQMVKRISEYPEGEERDELVRLTAHAMKRDYLMWNNDTVEDDLINQHLATLSEGRVQVPEGFSYKAVEEYMKGIEEERKANGNRKKKKKK
jgi:CRISPR/Cas system-associated endonuclease Cas1